MLGLLVLVYNLKVVYVVNIIVNLFGEEGILFFFFYEVNKLRIVVLKRKKRWCVDKIMFIIFNF